MEKVYSKPIDGILRKEIFEKGYFGELPEITGTLPEGKRDYYKRAGRDINESSAAEVKVTIGDVLDWLRESAGKNVSVEPYRDAEGTKYCGKVVDINTGLGSISYASEDFETALVSTIHDVLKEWK